MSNGEQKWEKGKENIENICLSQCFLHQVTQRYAQKKRNFRVLFIVWINIYIFSGGFVSILWRTLQKNGQIALCRFCFTYTQHTFASEQLKTIDYYWVFSWLPFFLDVDFSNYTQPRQPINWASKEYHTKYSSIHAHTHTYGDDDTVMMMICRLLAILHIRYAMWCMCVSMCSGFECVESP